MESFEGVINNKKLTIERYETGVIFYVDGIAEYFIFKVSRLLTGTRSETDRGIFGCLNERFDKIYFHRDSGKRVSFNSDEIPFIGVDFMLSCELIDLFESLKFRAEMVVLEFEKKFPELK